jgi:hypothetical protein
MRARPIRRLLIGELQASKLIVVGSYDLDADRQARS